MDQFTTAMLFENVQIFLNHHAGTLFYRKILDSTSLFKVTTKVSEADYSLSNYFLSRTNMSEESLMSTGCFSGYFGPENHEANYFASASNSVTFDEDNNVTALTPNSHCAVRRENGEIIDNTTPKTRRFYLSCKINNGFALSMKPLPKLVNVRIVFYRSHASRALLGCVKKAGSTTDFVEYPHKFIKIKSPILHAYYIRSEYYDKKFSRNNISKFRYDYPEYHVYRHILSDNVDHFQIPVATGVLPRSIIFGIMKIEQFTGTLKRSSVDFKNMNLSSIDIQVNNRSICHFPQKISGTYNCRDIFARFLKETLFYENQYTSGSLTYSQFKNYNFLITVDLERQNIFSGELEVTVKFKAPLTEKLFLVWMPIYQMKMTFDEEYTPSVEHSKALTQ